MTDTEEEFRKKDREYFDLIGLMVAHDGQRAQVIEYAPHIGPSYRFRLQYESGPRRGEEVAARREDFYVLSRPPTREEIAQAWYEREVENPASPYNYGEKKPINWIPWATAPMWRKRLPYSMADWFLTLLDR